MELHAHQPPIETDIEGGFLSALHVIKINDYSFFLLKVSVGFLFPATTVFSSAYTLKQNFAFRSVFQCSLPLISVKLSLARLITIYLHVTIFR